MLQSESLLQFQDFVLQLPLSLTHVFNLPSQLSVQFGVFRLTGLQLCYLGFEHASVLDQWLLHLQLTSAGVQTAASEFLSAVVEWHFGALHIARHYFLDLAHVDEVKPPFQVQVLSCYAVDTHFLRCILFINLGCFNKKFLNDFVRLLEYPFRVVEAA